MLSYVVSRVCLFAVAGSHTSSVHFAALPSSAGRVCTAVSNVVLELGRGLTC